ncbi:MAG: AmmeMemoRadiSam system radical SAM enzyme [Candidatus Auribacterota bacterium]
MSLQFRKEAEFWDSMENKNVRCRLCPHSCLIVPDKTGLCGIRCNYDGKLFAIGYGEIVSYAVDPIEKKPLYHFYPGSQILSVGVNGCNFRCQFCQNWQVSQCKQKTQYISPEGLIDLALRQDSIGIAFTYTEPLIWYEYIMDCAPLAHEHNLKIVLVSNGFISTEAAEKLFPNVDAINIDLKSMDPEFYRKICGGTLEPVLDCIRIANKYTHVEITNLLIPTQNDSDTRIRELVGFIESVSPEIPVHFSAYYPQYKMSIPATDGSALIKAYTIAKESLKYVYLGNIMTETGKNTCCPNCSATLIIRKGYRISACGLNGKACAKCNEPINIIL